MPAYIEVEQIETPTCGHGDECELNDNAAHHVSVKIGPAILDPVEHLLFCMEETHEETMGEEARMNGYHGENVMGWHRKDDPKCEYCRAIKNTAKMLKAVKGRAL